MSYTIENRMEFFGPASEIERMMDAESSSIEETLSGGRDLRDFQISQCDTGGIGWYEFGVSHNCTDGNDIVDLYEQLVEKYPKLGFYLYSILTNEDDSLVYETSYWWGYDGESHTGGETYQFDGIDTDSDEITEWINSNRSGYKMEDLNSADSSEEEDDDEDEEDDPDWDDHNALYRRGMAAFKDKDFKEAIRLFSRMLELELPNRHALTYKNRGEAYFELEDYDNAVSDFEEALRKVPSSTVYSSLLEKAKAKAAEVNADDDEPPPAPGYADEDDDAPPPPPRKAREPLSHTGKWYVMIDDEQQGPFALDELAEHVDAGAVTRESMVWQKGMADWEEAAAVGDMEAVFDFVEGNVPPPAPNGGKKTAPAATAPKASAKRDPAEAQKHFDAAFKLRKPEKKIVEYELAVALDPENETIRGWRANTYMDLGEYEKAAADFTICYEKTKRLTTIMSRAEAWTKAGKYDKAIADRTFVINAAKGKDAVDYINRAEVYALAGDYKKAVADYEKAFMLDPSCKDIYDDGYAAAKKKAK